MKLNLKLQKLGNVQSIFVCEHIPNKPKIRWYLILPTSIFNEVPDEMEVITHTASKDKKKHLCHKCGELYPAHQYAKHFRERHNPMRHYE